MCYIEWERERQRQAEIVIRNWTVVCFVASKLGIWWFFLFCVVARMLLPAALWLLLVSDAPSEDDDDSMYEL